MSIADQPLFEPWQDPRSGILSRLLRRRVAPHQQTFYFTNPSMSDGRHLWFYAAYPPAGERQLAVAKLATGQVRTFRESTFWDVSPWVDPATQQAYWSRLIRGGGAIFRIGIEPGSAPQHVWTLCDRWRRGRHTFRLTTHITPAAVGRELNVDAMVGDQWLLGTVDIESGDACLWATFDRMIDHSQFCPTDPDLMMFAQDWTVHPLTAQAAGIDRRIWLIRRGEKPRSLLDCDDRGDHTHEFWSADGLAVWYVSYASGTHRYDLRLGQDECVWPAGNCHAHASPDERYVVADCDHYPGQRRSGRPGRVAFFNRTTGRSVDIVSESPILPDRDDYHFDPHPQFTPDGQHVAYTTFVLGRADVALVDVAQLEDATR